MWPILIASLAALTVVIERIIFLIREKRSRCPETVEKIFSEVEKGKIEGAVRMGEGCNDFVYWHFLCLTLKFLIKGVLGAKPFNLQLSLRAPR